MAFSRSGWAVLQWHVDVRHQPRLRPHQPKDLLVERRRIGVEEANPREGGAGEEGLDQSRQAMATQFEILAERVVSWGQRLPRAPPDSASGLRRPGCHGPTAESAPPERNRTERTGVVTAFRDLEVGIALGRHQSRNGVVEHAVRRPDRGVVGLPPSWTRSAPRGVDPR